MEQELRRPIPAGGEGEEASSSAGSVGEMVDLSGRGLEQLPEHVLQRPGLENLYLEGNAISELSEDFFHRLPNLIWLDLRNNKLTRLPLSIGNHRCLKTLLLEGNPIRKLPVELGNVTSLKALNLRKCPIEFPPDGVLQQGLAIILAFLRKPGAIEAEHSAESACDTEMPVIEKLQLNALTESSLDFSDENERQQFKTLKQKLAQEERREGFLQSRKVWGAGFLSNVPSILRKEGSNPNAIFPESKAYDVSIQVKRKKDLRLAALKELKEKQAYIEQRKLDHKALKNWRDQAKLMQEKKERERKQRSPHPSEKNMIVKNAPFATDPNYYHTVRVADVKRIPVHKHNQKIDFEKEMEEVRL
ncbi:leucine-rich repeat-containing protein 27-like isoform X2 [Pristis pectinata]|uniref:leucine-rich repeat-containing protein 27-like isoform X2 n=1 Tax=Pristis pectinata TaxID=685728 RepID=UPI00223D5D19|nr:leucine-rich repeat-containing protein 27-like isoform X2 [Pristis pectinata]